MKQLLLPSVVLFLSLTTSAFAHDEKLHKGPMIEGKLLSISGDIAFVETKGGKVSVALSSETKFEAGTEGNAAKKSDLKEGQHVMVSGHKLESGELAATGVMIHSESGAGHKREGSEEPHLRTKN